MESLMKKLIVPDNMEPRGHKIVFVIKQIIDDKTNVIAIYDDACNAERHCWGMWIDHIRATYDDEMEGIKQTKTLHQIERNRKPNELGSAFGFVNDNHKLVVEKEFYFRSYKR
jgi:hypothetical protein